METILATGPGLGVEGTSRLKDSGTVNVAHVGDRRRGPPGAGLRLQFRGALLMLWRMFRNWDRGWSIDFAWSQ